MPKIILKPGSFFDQAVYHNLIHHQFPEMKALSWKNPFAELMFEGKDLETRRWNTEIRGWVLICATKKDYERRELQGICGDKILQIIQNKNLEFKNGMAIGIGFLGRVMPLNRYPDPEFRSFVASEHHPYLYGFQFQHLHRIEPFAFTGGQRWKNLTTDIVKKIIIC